MWTNKHIDYAKLAIDFDWERDVCVFNKLESGMDQSFIDIKNQSLFAPVTFHLWSDQVTFSAFRLWCTLIANLCFLSHFGLLRSLVVDWLRLFLALGDLADQLSKSFFIHILLLYRSLWAPSLLIFVSRLVRLHRLLEARGATLLQLRFNFRFVPCLRMGVLLSVCEIVDFLFLVGLILVRSPARLRVVLMGLSWRSFFVLHFQLLARYENLCLIQHFTLEAKVWRTLWIVYNVILLNILRLFPLPLPLVSGSSWPLSIRLNHLLLVCHMSFLLSLSGIVLLSVTLVC